MLNGLIDMVMTRKTTASPCIDRRPGKVIIFITTDGMENEAVNLPIKK
jgi:hypothetical protein